MYIRESEIMEFMYKGLTEMGYAVSESEAEAIAELVFDFLLEIGVLGEIEEE
jgi:hypothetical protein